MKLAEALSKRADLQKRINNLEARVANNLLVQEGDDPAEDPEALIIERDENAAELVELIKQINKTNNVVTVGSLTMMEAIVERDSFQRAANFHRKLAEGSLLDGVFRYSNSEIKQKRVLNVTQLQNEADQFSKMHRELDVEIQAANWNNDLLE